MIFANASTASVNFNNTIANAGAGDLVNAIAGSVVAFNASASTLTGAIQTDATSTTNVSLANGTTWNMTASSTMSSLNVANSAVVFSAPSAGGFKTLTVGSYFGTGASLSLNTMLGGSSSPTDQLIVNGGSATGLTALTIKNAGGAGALTTGAGIPVVVAVNGGTTAASAFSLANTPVVGGFEYSLGRDLANQDWYLTSKPASTLADIQNSVTSLAQSQFAQMVTGRLLSSLLLGATQQISGCDCGGGFGSVGSFGLGANGRWGLSDRLTLLAGFSYDQFSAQGADVTNAPIAAASLRYDPADWGRSRPFFELGAAIAPYMTVNYSRSYANGFTTSTGDGSTIDRSLSVFGRVGWVDRFTPVDEGAVLVDLVRGWQEDGGYSEPVTAVNPFAATVSSGVDSQYVARFGAQYTHLFFDRVEANVSAALAYGFDNRFGSPVYVIDFGPVAPYPLGNSAWTEFGGRLAYRFSPRLVARRVPSRNAMGRARPNASRRPRRPVRVLRPALLFVERDQRAPVRVERVLRQLAEAAQVVRVEAANGGGRAGLEASWRIPPARGPFSKGGKQLSCAVRLSIGPIGEGQLKPVSRLARSPTPAAVLARRSGLGS